MKTWGIPCIFRTKKGSLGVGSKKIGPFLVSDNFVQKKGGHLNMKVMGMYLPKDENMGHSVYDFIQKRGSLGVASKKIGPFLV